MVNTLFNRMTRKEFDMTGKISLHHIALSVRDAQASIEFYSHFGFTEAVVWRADDATLAIHQLINHESVMLELFVYAASVQKPRIHNTVGNNLEEIGIKHLGMRVDNLDEFRVAINSIGEVTDIVMGRTGFRYFFVKDPDGNWVEVVEDKRDVVPGGAVIDLS
jgi:glyoxalase family protein